MTKVTLGDEVEDTITGFRGIAIARTQWITGCDRIVVQPKVKKDGTLADNSTFDEPMLKIIKAVKLSKETTNDVFRGGPRPKEQKY